MPHLQCVWIGRGAPNIILSVIVHPPTLGVDRGISAYFLLSFVDYVPGWFGWILLDIDTNGVAPLDEFVARREFQWDPLAHCSIEGGESLDVSKPRSLAYEDRLSVVSKERKLDYGFFAGD